MSYEFNPESKIFEFPNPYKIENLALSIAGALFILCATGMLIVIRERMAQGIDGTVLKVIGVAIVLMVLGIIFFGWVANQLRFLFGRNRPDNLAPEIDADVDGDSKKAAYYKETLRQNALTYAEPKGSLNGLLYALLPSLIFAPQVVRLAVQAQFYNFLSLTATLISFLLCWLVYGRHPTANWIGIVYGMFTFMLIWRPMFVKDAHLGQEREVGIGSLVILILLAILGPVILGLVANQLPVLDHWNINDVVLVTLISSLMGSAVFGAALKNQLRPPPEVIGSARVTETVTMNSHPNKLIEELDRILLNRWYGNIPNRRYSRQSPEISSDQGKFTAALFQETQPRPQTRNIVENLGHAFASPQFIWLTCLTALGLVYLVFALIGAILVCQQILNGELVIRSILFSASLFLVGIFCLRSAHLLWGRFDFISELIWVDINGSYESARMNVGNSLTSQIQSSKNIINIESMTLNVWVSEIDTVIFGRNGFRQMVGLRGLPMYAEELAKSLKGFGETRSSIVAPSAPKDLERAHYIAEVGKVIAGDKSSSTGKQSEMLAGKIDVTSVATFSSQLALMTCSHCSARIDASDHFCGECGTAISG